MSNIKSIYFLSYAICIVLIFSCKSHTDTKPETVISDSLKSESSQLPFPEKFWGTWVSSSKTHFQMVEVIDSLKAILYHYDHWKSSYDSANKERFAYYKSEGNIVKWDQYSLVIQTRKYRFYYMIARDTLFEMAEPGRVDTLLRVYNDSTIER